MDMDVKPKNEELLQLPRHFPQTTTITVKWKTVPTVLLNANTGTFDAAQCVFEGHCFQKIIQHLFRTCIRAFIIWILTTLSRSYSLVLWCSLY